MKIAIGSMLMIGLCAGSARAVDGVVEINQACASGPGCFSGDAGGFPVQITTSGSYRLTSDLVPPDQNTHVVSIDAAGVTLDLNGFAIEGANPGPGCSAPGTGVGVIANVDAIDVALSNGRIRGMGSIGADLINASPARVDRVSAEYNCSHGIWVGNGSLVTASMAQANGGNGFILNPASQIIGSIANQNGVSGIAAHAGAVSVEACVANGNVNTGIASGSGSGSRVSDSTANGNGFGGILLEASSLVLRSTTNQNTLVGTGYTTGAISVGFITSNGNANFSVPPGTISIACSVLGGTQSCP